jgi:hypothetical protein
VDLGGLLQMLIGGSMGGSKMGGVTGGSSSTAPAPAGGFSWTKLAQGLGEAQQNGWGYGWSGALDRMDQKQPTTPAIGTGANQKELQSLLALLQILQGGSMTGGLGTMGGPPMTSRGGAGSSLPTTQWNI